ncbi:hypothetical protein [Dyadobacter sp. SG02]|uniref:hypothetical protein n=1 Tax=Dyadobacter sp. SG02 TaxID=1855291 RepID=UPI000B8651F5|nr:hypothetical protein [Dyadobacter sp. SG02]
MSLSVPENLHDAEVSDRPQDFILHSFNAFDPKIAKDPKEVFNKTSVFLKTPLTDSQIISQTFSQNFSATTKEYESSQESNSEFAASVGIEGSYGFFSGSLKSSYESEVYQKATFFNASFNAFIDCGTVSFYRTSDYGVIRACLQDDLCANLDAITTLKQAETFTNTYGTHLIGGLKLGGFIQLKSEAETTDYASKESLSVEVTLEYKGVSDISSAASVAQKLSTTKHSYSFTETASTSGGSGALGMAIDPKDKDTIIAWGNSCTKDTAYALSDTIEIFRLAAKTEAQNILQEYINLVILAQSIKRPTIFTAHINLKQYMVTSVDAVAHDPRFRIIGGGATVPIGKSNFLMNSYPHQDQNGNITGWTASTHDIAIPADTNSHLTSYAIAVYDPSYSGNQSTLLDVQVKTGNGSNPNIGRDAAQAKVDDGFILSGGGIQSQTLKGVEKYLLGSYPIDSSTWKAENSDYEVEAKEVNLTAYAIGVKSLNPALTIIASRISTPPSKFQYGNQVAQLGGGVSAVGGGVSVENAEGFGNLVQQTYPSSAGDWTEYDTDLDGHVTFANCAAYVIGFTPNLHI